MSPIIPSSRVSRRAVLAAGAAGSVLFAAGAGPASAQAPTADGANKKAKPTIVLVHGAFADASSWSAVIPRLQARGHTVVAPPNPLRGIGSDADYLRLFLTTVPGPVVLVGHSYGGAVVTNAATGNAGVIALVYVAAYALDEGETIGAANALGGGTALLGDHILPRPFPGSGPTDADVYIDPAYFRQVFANDLPARQAAVLAATQRPLVASALGTPSGPPAWRTIPSWYVVARQDRAIPPAAERAMAARANAHTVEINSSHAAMLSRPDQVVKSIVAAAGR